MNWYPWLNQAYRQLISMYQEGRGHHALLLHAIEGMGGEALSYGLSRWLMCQNKQGLKSCNECHSCRLMLAETHPDWHVLQSEKGKSSIGIEAIRKVTEKLEHHAQQSGSRIVWIKDVEALTEAAANALLKTLEEPPKNTYFLLNCQQPEVLLATLRSRCFYYHLATPDLQHATHWLQQQLPNIPYANSVTALNLSQNAPILALSLLKDEWKERETFCQALYTSIQQRNLYAFLPQLNQDNAEHRLYWLLSLLLGLGIHITYSAYLADNKGIANSSMWVVILSCMVCVLAGLMIFPALSAAGLEPNAGPGLTFMTMPVYFANLPGGNILAVTFFVLLLMAALTSAISLLEHIVAYVQMRFQWTRRRAGLVVTASIMLMGIPVSLSFGPMSDVTLGGKTVFDLLDYLTSNILMPLFGIAMCLIFGWSSRANAFIPENITGLKRQSLLLVWRYIGPICIGIILVHGLIG